MRFCPRRIHYFLLSWHINGFLWESRSERECWNLSFNGQSANATDTFSGKNRVGRGRKIQKCGLPLFFLIPFQKRHESTKNDTKFVSTIRIATHSPSPPLVPTSDRFCENSTCIGEKLPTTPWTNLDTMRGILHYITDPSPFLE